MSEGPVSREALLSALARLRSEGERCPDPVRLRYLEELAQRMQAAQGSVQRVLQSKLQHALTAFAPALEATELVVQERAGAVSDERIAKGQLASEPVSPLARLNQHIAVASQVGQPEAAQRMARPELKSAERFRETWARISAENEVDQAVHRQPLNAGPLNSHSLVLRTLGLMRELSPDYLRRFLSHTETLLWLDNAHAQLKQPAAISKPTRQGRQKK